MTSIVVAGAIANKPGKAGAAWTRASWALGFASLGFDVHFVEQLSDGVPDRCAAVAWFDTCTRAFGLAGRSTLLAPDASRIVGLELAELAEVIAGSAALVNISGHLRLAAADRARCRIYIDLDPGYTQIWLERGLLDGRAHDHWFTVGTRVGHGGCTLPTGGIEWVPTLQPVDIERWPVVERRAPGSWTTIASWRGYGPIEVDAELLGPKAHEFRRIIDLPGACPDSTFELALDIHADDEPDRQALVESGWRLVDPSDVAGDPASFASYIRRSMGELSVAQAAYARTRSGWFSDRTARYLASGLPAVVQDTGLRVLPTGGGLVTFTDRDSAARAIDAVRSSYDDHCRAARELAVTHLRPEVVLGAICERAGAAP